MHKRHKPEAGPIVWSIEPEVLIHFAYAPDWGRFHTFSSKASILSFNEGVLRFPSKQESYNNDLNLPSYPSSARTYADKQRKGVMGERNTCLSVTEHVTAALEDPFFLSPQTPLPASTTEAALFLRDSPGPALISFWNTQIKSPDALVEASAPIEEQWEKLIPPFLLPAAGKIKLAALMSLAHQCNLGGSQWLQQFLFVSELVGALSHTHSYPPRP